MSKKMLFFLSFLGSLAAAAVLAGVAWALDAAATRRGQRAAGGDVLH